MILPINIIKQDINHFKLYGRLKRPKILFLNNVTITYDGLCLNALGLIGESTYGDRDNLTASNLKTQLSILKFKTMYFNDFNRYILIHGPKFSYYHWLTESIPRLLKVKKWLKGSILILPRELKNNKFVNDSLKPFEITNITYIEKNTNIKVQNLILSQLKPFCNLFYTDITKKIRNIYTDFARSTIHLEDKSIIFLSNDINDKLKIINLNEVQHILNKYKICYTDIMTYNFYDQIQIINNTKVIISSTGNDFACMIFLPTGGSIFELCMQHRYEYDYPDLRFYNLAKSLDLDYYYQFCDYKRKSNKYQIYVDINLFEKTILKIIYNWNKFHIFNNKS